MPFLVVSFAYTLGLSISLDITEDSSLSALRNVFMANLHGSIRYYSCIRLLFSSYEEKGVTEYSLFTRYGKVCSFVRVWHIRQGKNNEYNYYRILFKWTYWLNLPFHLHFESKWAYAGYIFLRFWMYLGQITCANMKCKRSFLDYWWKWTLFTSENRFNQRSLMYTRHFLYYSDYYVYLNSILLHSNNFLNLVH